jgi:WD40 repeat protein
MTMDKPSPYVGTRAYRRGEELFGREQETRDLVRLVLAERVVLLYSPSGAGKTSLLAAKVIPSLEREDFQVLGPARVSDPDGGLVEASAGQQPEGGDIASQTAGPTIRTEGPAGSINRYVASLIAYWEEGRPKETPPLQGLTGIDLAGYLTQRSWIRSDPRPKLLVLDQFEEIFTLDPRDLEARKDLFVQLGRALQDRNRWGLIAMREEHIAGLDPYLELISTRLAARYRLELLSPENAREAIAEPARSLGVTYHSSTLDMLISELTAVREREAEYHTAYIEPLHLQVVCDRLWQRLPAGTTEVAPDLLDTAGTVGEALEAYYREAVLHVIRMPAAIEARCDERMVRDWFGNELISPAGLRKQLQRGGETTGGVPNAIVDAFKERYLLRSELRRGTLWYELAHDRLIEAIRSDNAAWYEGQPELRLLAVQVKRWQDHLDADHPVAAEADLLAGTLLKQVEDWVERNGRSLTSSERRFLAACRERRGREEEKVLAAKRRFRLRLWIALAMVSAVLIVVNLGWRYKLDAENEKLEMQRYWASWEKGRAEKLQIATTEARVHRLLSDAAGVRWRQGNHELAVLLALQAERFTRDLNGVAPAVSARIQESLLSMAALRPFTLSPQLAGVRRSSWDPAHLAFSPDGGFIALGSPTNEIEIIPLSADPPDCIRPLIRTGGNILALNFSGAGRYLVAVTASGAELFSTENLACAARVDPGFAPDLQVRTSAGPPGPFCTARDDALLALALPGEGFGRYRLEQGGLVPDWHEGDAEAAGSPGTDSATAMACDPDGGWVAVGTAGGGIRIWTDPAGGSGSSLSLHNSLDAWPEDIRDDFKFLESALDYGVSELLAWPGASHVIAVFRHGPPALVPLHVEAGQEPTLIYLRPTQCSQEKLDLLSAIGRASRALVHKPKLLQAAFDAGRRRLIAGGERRIGEWDLCTFHSDPCGLSQAELSQSPPPRQLFTRYSESGTSLAPITALSVLEAAEITADADAELNLRLRLSKGLGNVGSSSSAVRIGEDEGGLGVLYSMRFLGDGLTLAAGGSKYLTFVNVNAEDLTLSESTVLPCLPRSVRAMTLSPDGRRMALVTARNLETNPRCLMSPTWGRHSVLLLDLHRESGDEAPREPQVLEADTSGMWSASWTNSPWTGGRHVLAAGDYDGIVQIWSWAEGDAPPVGSRAQQLPMNQRSPIRALAFHPTDPYLAVGQDDGSLKILHLRIDSEGEIRMEALQNPDWDNQGPVRALAWSPDGKTLAFGNESGVIGLVPAGDLQSGSWKQSQHTFAHSMGITALAFDKGAALRHLVGGDASGAAGFTLASGGGDGKVRLWSLQGEPEQPPAALHLRLTLEGPKAEAQSVAFSPDGKLLAAGDARGNLHLWRTELAPILVDACTHLRRNLSRAEWSEYIGKGVPYQQTCPNLPLGAGVRVETVQEE